MRTTLEQFFSGKFLKIPAYQRDYAWEADNIDELWDDIDEEHKASSPHLYNASAYVSTRRFGAEIQGRPAGLTAFGRADIDARTSMLVDFCAGRWSL